MKEPKNYLNYTFGFTLVLTVALLAISFIPPFDFGATHFKRGDILGDIVERNDVAGTGSVYFDTTFLAEYNVRMEQEANREPELEVNPETHTSLTQEVTLSPSRETTRTREPNAEPLPAGENVIALEDFGKDHPAMDHFFSRLTKQDKKGPIRIAVLGDSFIEGDIFTADLRAQLQDIYGGSGVGFIPFAHPFSQFKATVGHTYDHWKIENVIKKKDLDSLMAEKFFISGMINLPQEGAVTTMKGVTFRKHLKEVQVARLIFINERQAKLNVVINDSLTQQYSPSASPYVQQIVLKGHIQSIEVSVSDPEGFIGYGVMLEDNDGITVDNYSLRGNSGLALFGTSRSINTQIDKLIGGYDLIVLQYGLNVMSPDVEEYGYYSVSLRKVIDYMRSCFPQSSILVMGVGDRATLRNGEFVTMPAVPALIQAQQRAARNTEVAFWNTFLAMGGNNSMSTFVEKNWAAKDHTHIGHAGGRFIAREFIKALSQGSRDYEKRIAAEAAAAEAERIARERAVRDSLNRTTPVDTVLNSAGQENMEMRSNER